MENYKRRDKANDVVPLPPGEIRVRSNVRWQTIETALKAFEGGEQRLVLRALGVAISTAVTICEIIRRRVLGLHTILRLESVQLQEEYEPLISGLPPKTVDRRISAIAIVLTKNPTADELAEIGYQTPLPEDQVTEGDQRPKSDHQRPPKRHQQRTRANGPRKEGTGERGAARLEGAAPAEGGAATSKPRSEGGRRRRRGSRRNNNNGEVGGSAGQDRSAPAPHQGDNKTSSGGVSSTTTGKNAAVGGTSAAAAPGAAAEGGGRGRGNRKRYPRRGGRGGPRREESGDHANGDRPPRADRANNHRSRPPQAAGPGPLDSSASAH